MADTRKVLALLGFAQKAGKLISGDDAVTISIRSGQSKMVIVADDASEKIKSKFKFEVENSGMEIPIYYFGEKEQLGNAIGKPPRGIIAVIDENFSKGIKTALETKGL